MDSSVSPKDEIWFLRMFHHISNAVYPALRIAEEVYTLRERATVLRYTYIA